MKLTLYPTITIAPSRIAIISLPTYANLGQIAIDGVISVLANSVDNRIIKIGIIDSDCIAPMTGYEEFSEEWGNTLCFPFEGIFSRI